ncbi:fluoride efflux transporter CrcB [Tepidamorphus sp. 3E244]|uniref:fluoride efflux transporter CrcB n=1 Tax=Tepidamorphus sp. 3E244 TaxID=3385498 RepID=UPI0038FCFE5A
MSLVQQALLVACGGGAGAASRFLVGLWAASALGTRFPWGTIIVNVVGSFLIACFVEYIVARGEGSSAMRLLLVTGFLGGFTTFSAFSLDTMALAERGETGLVLLYVGGSVLLSIAACWAGLVAMRSAL